ncbi:hypothetical protein DAPPUDRAFT_305009 [Daphnia pulex]|uniref:Cuticular protein n=1 Tax=Daphnia pulex TaxID=6669 RepID=E9GNE6_DAPPU|nr:hypothetical protein DAPPUDRAFT_305009 [Daphnia pulex]|eukprot:EFX79016.1 hypothetical protein DAPPUDRAFT_305009 [Daphnia pulex]
MIKLIPFQVLVVIVFCALLQASGEEESKPYQFGFNLGTQHREERKDANGIVIGEYGFLTADGYYQTVIYATDKEGRFLITGRKRVRVTPPKPRPEVEGRQGRENSDFPTTTTTTTTERSKIYQFNYTALQHGRQEMGFSDSSKTGDYYWDGPDGYRRIITYNAEDGKGYRPTIKQVKLPIQ